MTKVKLLSEALNDTFHAGISFLRTQNASTLRQMEKTCILHDHAQPIAVLIPYELFMGIICMSPYLIDSMPNIVLDSRKGLIYI